MKNKKMTTRISLEANAKIGPEIAGPGLFTDGFAGLVGRADARGAKPVVEVGMLAPCGKMLPDLGLDHATDIVDQEIPAPFGVLQLTIHLIIEFIDLLPGREVQVAKIDLHDLQRVMEDDALLGRLFAHFSK